MQWQRWYNQRDCERHHRGLRNWSCEHENPTVLPARDWVCQIHTQKTGMSTTLSKNWNWGTSKFSYDMNSKNLSLMITGTSTRARAGPLPTSPCPHTGGGSEGRGLGRLLLPPLLPLAPADQLCKCACALLLPTKLFSSSSSRKALLRRNLAVVTSTLSPPASDATTRRGASPAECRTVRPLRCGPGSARMPGRAPGGRAVCARRPSCEACSSTSLALAPVFGPRGAAFCCALWCVAAARAMRTVCCSCRHHERSRRSRRRLATPPAEGRTLHSPINSQHSCTKKRSQTWLSLVVVVVVVVVVRTWVVNDGSLAMPHHSHAPNYGSHVLWT